MPCADANGLLPGRGPAGRWPMPCADENGLLPGRGAPGFGAASPEGFAAVSSPDAGAAGAAGAGVSAGAAGASVTGASGAGFGAGFGPGTGAPGFGARPGAAGLAPGAADLAPEAEDAAAGAASPDDFRDASDSMAARSLRATGGSMVEEGLLTNSPSSLSFASAILLSTPSSAAISCTRGLPATILLSGVGPPRQGRPLVADGSHFEPFTLFP